VGVCDWNANSTGGVLTLIYSSPVGPQHVYYNVTYVNEDTISVYGDIFYRH
jgi:hypothetical protein